ncbi:unnamed protein product [Miscanthus lutarioriparius]|uniref:Uncharacterized protein n=1 Tax=Miscanthus lutarioriparius TaxID=422564 RepID=A0A811PYE5_9POAL|nr:unnamed protein product [Miscanthus lutarioriparius]
MAQDVTNKIADAVEQLMDLDVEKVMLSTLPPIGCTPWLSRSSDYSTCGSQTVFKDEIQPRLATMFKRLTSGSGSFQSKKFKHN